jgi:hypothetical protein
VATPGALGAFARNPTGPGFFYCLAGQGISQTAVIQIAARDAARGRITDTDTSAQEETE